MVWGREMRRRCVWRDRASGPVVLERVVADFATSSWTGGRCRCVLAMGNSVAPVLQLVVAHHKDSQCAAVMHRSGAEFARDAEKLKGTRRCCRLHVDGSPSASDRREVQVCVGHGELSGSGTAFGSCSSQGLPVRSRNASQWCRVRMRRGEAQKY